jgi:hypothetical protein
MNAGRSGYMVDRTSVARSGDRDKGEAALELAAKDFGGRGSRAGVGRERRTGDRERSLYAGKRKQYEWDRCSDQRGERKHPMVDDDFLTVAHLRSRSSAILKAHNSPSNRQLEA